jgi:hypothetical protein
MGSETLGMTGIGSQPLAVHIATAPSALEAVRTVRPGTSSVLVIGKFHDETTDALREAATTLLDRGICAFAACGTDSERFHDTFDAAAWAREPRTIMSVWFAWPDWQSALEYHLAAGPDEAWEEAWDGLWIVLGEDDSPVTLARIREPARRVLGLGS